MRYKKKVKLLLSLKLNVKFESTIHGVQYDIESWPPNWKMAEDCRKTDLMFLSLGKIG